jgi:hypothetical protein
MICSTKGVTKWPKKITMELASRNSMPVRFIQSAARGIWSSACPKGKCCGQVTSIRCSKIDSVSPVKQMRGHSKT